MNEAKVFLNESVISQVDNARTDHVLYALDFFYAFCVPVICFFSICTNLIDFIVFSHKELKSETFKYLKMNAISNIFYLTICFFLFAKRCGQFCELDTTYTVQLYYIVFYRYVKGIQFIII